MNITRDVTVILDLFERWREMGSRRLASGVELVGRVPDEDGEAWMHVAFPGSSAAALATIEQGIGSSLPAALRAYYRCCGGLSLFLGAFHLCGLKRRGVHIGDHALQPMDIVALNHEIDVLGWRPPQAVAFAVNSWDASVHLVGTQEGSDSVVRCARATGAVIETHANVFACIADRLERLDQVLIR